MKPFQPLNEVPTMLQILPTLAMRPTTHAKFHLRTVQSRRAVCWHGPYARRTISDVA